MIDDRDLGVFDGLRRLENDWDAERDASEPTERPTTSAGISAQLAASIVLPGSAALRRAPFVAIGLLGLGVVLPIVLLALIYVNRSELVGFALDPTFLLAAMIVGLLAVITRFIAIGEIAARFRHTAGIWLKTSIAAAVVVAGSLPVLAGVSDVNSARSALGGVFASESSDPLFSPDGSATSTSSAPVDPSAVKNVLIMGGDAGPGRWGMRTDTMMLVTVHEASGRVALTSIPRNLTSLQFPPGSPLAAEFPNGFDDLANALFTHVNSDPALVEYYGASGLQPEAIALVEALGYSLDVEIDDFALVNMQGFTEVIDAVGGVTLELAQSVPLPPSLPGERELPTSIGPGVVEMDGALAIAYARSRSADSDYQRMGRQRQLMAALGSQVSATDALGAFGSVTGALDDSMRTSLSSGEFNDLLDRLGDNSAISESVGLAPPLITPGNPDYAQIRDIVNSVQAAVIAGQPSGYAT
ncbi:LCP family protein [Ilumatobacter coccineus]|uniref:Putative LytR family regulatory protein n=1 Tax=Ilumatobacter coccineus (strain NBRC 103263 / KCTC 29153 / YM16-304) TaxID=1313172 RepID=A0A6C7E2F0_ILUCY|nr:LCP family protein [Ilumatobacter coccineus]BAN01257.1 putative LytR family regulatory protein [Ilumatobacter coccineus YM16-304]